MDLIDQVHRIFAAADQMNLDEWIAYFVDDARFRFGNAEPITGRAAIRSTMKQFFSTIKAMHHEFEGMYEQDNVVSGQLSIVIAEANVTFTRLDDKVVYSPATTIFRMRGDRSASALRYRVQDFRLYMDAAPIFA